MYYIEYIQVVNKNRLSHIKHRKIYCEESFTEDHLKLKAKLTKSFTKPMMFNEFKLVICKSNIELFLVRKRWEEMLETV